MSTQPLRVEKMNIKTIILVVRNLVSDKLAYFPDWVNHDNLKDIDIWSIKVLDTDNIKAVWFEATIWIIEVLNILWYSSIQDYITKNWIQDISWLFSWNLSNFKTRILREWYKKSLN